MPTSWTLTAGQICRDALEHLQIVGAGETVTAEDQVTALRGLDAVLKELPLSGYSWPKLSGEVALTWSVGTPQTASLPADYYNYPVVWKAGDGETVLLTQIPHAEWVKMLDRDATAEQPTHFYISPAKVLHFWPVPTVDPEATLQYQKIVDDSAATSAPDIPQYWLNALGWGVADEISMKFGVAQPLRVEVNQRWTAKKGIALQSSIPSEPISFSVDD